MFYALSARINLWSIFKMHHIVKWIQCKNFTKVFLVLNKLFMNSCNIFNYSRIFPSAIYYSCNFMQNIRRKAEICSCSPHLLFQFVIKFHFSPSGYTRISFPCLSKNALSSSVAAATQKREKSTATWNKQASTVSEAKQWAAA